MQSDKKNNTLFSLYEYATMTGRKPPDNLRLAYV